jgi:hypothetical protein
VELRLPFDIGALFRVNRCDGPMLDASIIRLRPLQLRLCRPRQWGTCSLALEAVGRAAIGGHLGQAVIWQTANDFRGLTTQAAGCNRLTGRVDVIPTSFRSGRRPVVATPQAALGERGLYLVCQPYQSVASRKQRVDLTPVVEGRVFAPALARASPEVFGKPNTHETGPPS